MTDIRRILLKMLDAGGATDTQVLTYDAASDRWIPATPTGGVPTSRQIIAGTGLTGGGTLAADRTLAVDISAELERIQDAVAAMFVDGTNITHVYDDTTGTLTVTASGSGGGVPTSRQIIAGTGLTGGGDLTADRTLAIDTTSETERIQDAIGAMIVDGTNVSHVYDDTAGTLTISASLSGAGGSSLYTPVTRTSAYTAVAGDIVLANANGGAFTVTLPASPTTGCVVVVKKVDSSTNRVTIASTDLIDGSSSKVIYSQWGWITMVWSGTTWEIISAYAAGASAPTVRAGKISYVNNTNTVNATLPTGTVAGDTLVMFAVHGFGPNTPTGWTVVATNFGKIMWKVATSTDITNGFITVTFPGSYYGEIALISVQNANAAPIRTFGTLDSPTKGATVFTLGNAKPGDLILYFSSSRQDTTSGMNLTSPTPGTLVDSRIADVDYSAYIYQATQTDGESIAGWNITWSVRQTNVDQFDAIAVVKG
jgi:hypothetical protein